MLGLKRPLEMKKVQLVTPNFRCIWNCPALDSTVFSDGRKLIRHHLKIEVTDTWQNDVNSKTYST